MRIRGIEAADKVAKRAAADSTVTKQVLLGLQQGKAHARHATTCQAYQGHLEMKNREKQAAWHAIATGYHPLGIAHQQPG